VTLAPELNDDAFTFFQTFVLQRSAIVVSDEKRYLVETRLCPVARQAGLSGLDELVQRLRRGRDNDLEAAVVDAMTTNETSWFRDDAPFVALIERVLPDRIAANATRRSMSIWSAACSTGQEPFSVAMLLDEHFPEVTSWKVDLLATDLSASALERARRGRFSALEVSRGLPESYRLAHLRAEGSEFVLDQAILSRVRFKQMNLAEPWPPMAAQDVILMRNVLIYFDAPTRQRVLTAARAQLRPGGYLVLGAAETARDLVQGLVPVRVAGTSVYRLEPT